VIAQVAPLLTSQDFLDYHTYSELGWKGVIFAVLVGSLIFSVVKHHIGFISIGPNEGGIRELFGLKLWKLGPGPHFYISGFSTVRKAPLGISEVDLAGEFSLTELTWQYSVVVLIQVLNSRDALIARIYKAEDSDKTDMQNTQNTKQVTAILKRNLRILLESGATAVLVETELKTMSEKQIEGYGSEICNVLVCELVKRPLSEVADAIRNSGNPLGAISDQMVNGTHHPLVALEGGVGTG